MTTYTLLQLCRAYSKIEIPILQRAYVQGSDTRVRTAFVHHLVTALESGKPIELDFVYGAERCENEGSKVLIPLDGQQRLTTLWLLHIYLMAKDRVREQEYIDDLSRFVYETRPAAQDFCIRLVRHELACLAVDDERREAFLSEPKAYLTNRGWFDDEWQRDMTVVSMLGMLQEIAGHRARLEDVPFATLSGEGALIRFYYLPLERFGLSNELYIRMNARGEQLTGFEHFKSSFYKVLQDKSSFEDIKEKMEYEWVEALWQYRPDGVYVTDEPFMKLLSFVTETNDIKAYQGQKDYTKPKPMVSNHDPYTELPFVLETYQDQKNVERLVDALDALESLGEIVFPMLLEEENSRDFGKKIAFKDLLDKMLKRSLSISERILMYTAIQYIKKNETIEGVLPMLRLVRNLTVHTPSVQVRDLQRIYNTIDDLVGKRDIYIYMAGSPGRLPGFSEVQQEEEEWKARLRQRSPEAQTTLDALEDYFGGNIRNLLCVVLGVKDLSESCGEGLDLDLLNRIFEAYKEQYEADKFVSTWGDLLMSDAYQEAYNSSRWVVVGNWQYARGLMGFLKDYVSSGLSLEAFCIAYERQELKRLREASGGELSTLTKPSEQLFVYYVITRRLMGREVGAFFAGGYNFGWLSKEKGYSSIFDNPPAGWAWSKEAIYQTYNSHFRWGAGLKKEAALPTEVVGEGRIQMPFERLGEWIDSMG